jgi:alkylation response protein AidB-like acyl-CoA dehydrogenase
VKAIGERRRRVSENRASARAAALGSKRRSRWPPGWKPDTIVEQVFREIRSFRIYDGPTEVHKWSLAKRIKREARAR